MNNLKDDYRKCEEVIKKNSLSFYAAFKNLPSEEANAVYSIYVFNRIIDDIVDETPDQKAALEKYRDFYKEYEFFKNRKHKHSYNWRALRDTVDKYNIPYAFFEEQLEGQRRGIGLTGFSTEKELEEYSRLVAGSVGKMLLPVLSSSYDRKMERACEELGIAMQYTNILRDISEDAKVRSQVYLPEDLMKEYGISIEHIKEKRLNDSCTEMIWKMIEKANTYYDSFKDSIPDFKVKARLPLMLALVYYREILREIEKDIPGSLEKRVVISSKRKMELFHETRKEIRNRF